MKFFRETVIVFGAIFASSAISQASTIRDDTADSLYTSFADSNFQSTGFIYGNSPTVSGAGSATLIGSNWVLTAAHVGETLIASTGVGGGNGFKMTDNLSNSATTYGFDQVYIDPSYDGNVNHGHDFALVHLSGTGVTNVNPLQLYAGNVALGTVTASVGYGSTGTGLTGNTNTNNQLRRGFENVVDGLDNATIGLPGFITDFDIPAGTTNTLGNIGSSATPLALEGCVANGDSGGGLYMQYNGSWVQIGVTSYVASPNVETNLTSFYGDVSGYDNITADYGWIYNTSGIQAVPEPKSLVIFGLGIGAVILRKRVR